MQKEKTQRAKEGVRLDYRVNRSNSSYYNQPVHKPQGQAFSTAALVCGIVSVTTCCAVVISLPLGALGLIFAHLARRQGKPVNSTCLLGQVCSWVGLVCAGALLIYSLAMLPSLQSPGPAVPLSRYTLPWPGRLSGFPCCRTMPSCHFRSNEMVSFKSPQHVSPENAASAVRAHEQEHVSNAYKKAAKDFSAHRFFYTVSCFGSPQEVCPGPVTDAACLTQLMENRISFW